MVTAGYSDFYALTLTRQERLGAIRAYNRIQEQSYRRAKARYERDFTANQDATDKDGAPKRHRLPLRAR